MPRRVIVTIGPDGKAVVEVEGCAGPSCKSLTAALETALGTVTNDVKKPEFLQQAKQTTAVGVQASGGRQ